MTPISAPPRACNPPCWAVIDDPKIVGFPKTDVPPEELIRRQRVEAERLARLSPGEWQLWIDNSATQLGIPRATLEAAVRAIIAQREKDDRERKAEAERDRRRLEKAAAASRQTKARVFKTLDTLPEAEHDKRLDELARGLGESPDTVRREFAESLAPPVESKLAPWPEPVDSAALLDDVAGQIRRYVVLRDEALTAATLFTVMTWVHDSVAVYSPVLGIASNDPYSGKTTLMSVLGWMVPKPFRGVELTGPAAFRIIDREHPTMIIDEADDLFLRKKDLAHVINASWTRGTLIYRNLPGQAGVHGFDPFCPKIIGMLGSKVPGTTASRFIPIKMLPRLPEEAIEDFLHVHNPEFVAIRRKLVRWAADNVATLGDAKPEQPPGFHNRVSDNWRLLFAIADVAGGDWPARARRAALKLAGQHAEPSQGRRLHAALRTIYGDREEMTSEDIVAQLVADPTAEWCEFGRGRSPITQRQLAVLLAEYDIRPISLHPTKKATLSRQGYRRSQFADVWARLLPSNPITQSQKPQRDEK
jgi:putative DNA primase/helicase